MHEAFRAFHEGLIDYAGLFPPAKLDLSTAIGNYAEYRGCPDAWMLGKFIIPAVKLEELSSSHGRLFDSSGDPYRFSVLVGTESLEQTKTQLALIREFVELHAGSAVVEALETRFPLELLEEGDTDAIADFVSGFEGALEEAELAGVEAYFEAPISKKQAATDRAAIEGMAAFRSRRRETSFGLKLRCGGLEPGAFPTPARVAEMIHGAYVNMLPLKFTAGLHHPVRHFNEGVGTLMHGFLNVFGAAVLGLSHRLDVEQIERIVADTESTHFSFDTKGFHWRSLKATPEALIQARYHFAVGFGSCSFDEPRDDLRALNML